jgi:RNA polymerase sigma-70 factor (ECF subfamily)
VAGIRPIAEVQEELLPTRKSLLTRLKHWDDDESWRTFFEMYWKLIYCAAMRAGLKDEEAQEVVQETVINVSKSIKTFKYRPENGSFKGWLLQLTRWRIKDQLRRRQRRMVTVTEEEANRAMYAAEDMSGQAPGDTREELENFVSEASWDEGWESTLLDAALTRLKARVDARQYQVFHQLVLKGRTPNEVARALKISKAKIYLIKHRLNNLLKKEISALRAKPLSQCCPANNQ